MRRRALLSGDKKDYLTMVVTTGGDVTWTGSTSANTLSYSKDNGNTWTTATGADTISVNAGDKVLWKGTPTPTSDGGIGSFSGDSAVRFDVEGNVMSLLFGDNFIGQKSLSGKDYAFLTLFKGNENVVSIDKMVLPATTLAVDCYRSMFQGCTSLTTVPSDLLPATTLAVDCYRSMFSDCTSLTTAPQLPATTLANNCYQGMFANCTNLETAPSLPATTLTSGCYAYMFYGCTSLTTAPSLPATTLTSGCYAYMFRGCKSLTTAPDLPATTLASSCYREMFLKCASLNSIKCLATDISASNCTYNWVNNVAASGTFTKAANMTDWTTGISGIPDGWTVRTAAEDFLYPIPWETNKYFATRFFDTRTATKLTNNETDIPQYFQWNTGVGYVSSSRTTSSDVFSYSFNNTAYASVKNAANTANANALRTDIPSNLDIVTLTMGAGWRMATQSELQNIFNMFNAVLETRDGVNGFRLDDTLNEVENIAWFPITGTVINKKYNNFKSITSWTSTYKTYNSSNGYVYAMLGIKDATNKMLHQNPAFYGAPIIPVYEGTL